MWGAEQVARTTGTALDPPLEVLESAPVFQQQQQYFQVMFTCGKVGQNRL